MQLMRVNTRTMLFTEPDSYMIYDPCLQLMGSWRAECISVGILMLYTVLGSALPQGRASGRTSGRRLAQATRYFGPDRGEYCTRALHRLCQIVPYQTSPSGVTRSVMLESSRNLSVRRIPIPRLAPFVVSKGHEISAPARVESFAHVRPKFSYISLPLELIMLCNSFLAF